MTTYLVIFGAAVRPDGSASGSLRRRCESALAAAAGVRDPMYLPTGGVGRYGKAEALVARDILLAAGVEPSRVVIEDRARDTLQSVRRCAAILRRRGDADELLVCTSGYHAPRCTLLFRLAGFRARAAAAAPDRPHLGTPKWLRYVVKECLATPWDALLLLGTKMLGRS